jgi:predicted RNA-binding Zn-ribbon protein involved in translation (DUF1610 family)
MSDFTEATKAVSNELACAGCGAILKFKPGTLNLVCEYCGAQNPITQPDVKNEIEEISLDDFFARNFNNEEKIEVATVKCESCGATSTLDPRISSDKCPFCAATLVVKSGTTSTLHKPQYVLPFGIDIQKASANFKSWMNRLWFAPNDLKKYADSADKLNGMYLPFWTFDCNTSSSYTGQRGEDYYVNESYTTTENGKTVTRTRQVTRTRWYPAAGNVSNIFDDLLIEATRSLNSGKLRALEPWDLKNLLAYNDKFLSGFRTETYAVDVKQGYTEAKQRMEPEIRSTICRDIGGDRQMIHFVNTTYRNPTFKHILLPVWISAYRYNNKVYQFLVNARTGEVQGERPYSAVKIALAVIGGLVLAIILYSLFGQSK